ncbi:hypothetical protein Vretimale_12009 [Volvox reticuliferus]|uniref:Uncharacterized protein n=1 Tax=Volvox reticuliferus TaxID=1737510 RepID=A0A8J4GHL0_9CHLO|nr:hypothetical protein Vretimale_12009 [Volvox reticuliferus]
MIHHIFLIVRLSVRAVRTAVRCFSASGKGAHGSRRSRAQNADGRDSGARQPNAGAAAPRRRRTADGTAPKRRRKARNQANGNQAIQNGSAVTAPAALADGTTTMPCGGAGDAAHAAAAPTTAAGAPPGTAVAVA